MKRTVIITIVTLVLSLMNSISAQEVQTIKMEQTEGEFNIKGLTLSEGTYKFEVTNNGVDHKVGFVIAPKGMTEQKDHIQSAYLSETIKSGDSSSSGEVILTKGEYVFFCPMNPTPEYTIVVE